MNFNQTFQKINNYSPNSAPTKENGHGRVNLYTSIPQYDYESQKNVDYGFQNNALAGIQETTPLSNLFFSNENVEKIQNGIIRGVSEQSNGQYQISNQSQDQLLIIMRAIYLQNSLNQRNNIEGQCNTLNKMVIDYAVRKIIPEIQSYIRYQKDITSNPQPLAHPQNVSMVGTRSREFKSFF
jgi:hypothetical protein